MTANQINYFKAREEQRYHKASEDLSRESNEISRSQAEAALRNAATNEMNANTQLLRFSEESRSNRANEAIQSEKNRLQAEYNTTSILESQRHNVATESEASRHNQAAETLELREQQVQQSGQRANVLTSLISAAGRLGAIFAR